MNAYQQIKYFKNIQLREIFQKQVRSQVSIICFGNEGDLIRKVKELV